MKLRNLSQFVAVTVLAIGVTACGGGGSTAQKAVQSAASAAAGAAQNAAGTAGNMAGSTQSALGAQAPVNINCGAVRPVWVNLKTKAYHEPGDPWYGRTKEGAYMCPSAAAAKGYHPAGHHKGMTGGAMQGAGNAMQGAAQGAAGAAGAAAGAAGAAAGQAGTMMGGETKKHRRHHAAGETPSPGGTP